MFVCVTLNQWDFSLIVFGVLCMISWRFNVPKVWCCFLQKSFMDDLDWLWSIISKNNHYEAFHRKPEAKNADGFSLLSSPVGGSRFWLSRNQILHYLFRDHYLYPVCKREGFHAINYSVVFWQVLTLLYFWLANVLGLQ